MLYGVKNYIAHSLQTGRTLVGTLENKIKDSLLKLQAFSIVFGGKIVGKEYVGADTPEKTDDVLRVTLSYYDPAYGMYSNENVVVNFYDKGYTGPEAYANPLFDVSSLNQQLQIGNFIDVGCDKVHNALYTANELVTHMADAYPDASTGCFAWFALMSAIVGAMLTYACVRRKNFEQKIQKMCKNIKKKNK